LKRHFSTEDTQIANEHMKKMLSIISHQGDANQNPNEIYFTYTRMAVVKDRY
jgi:hypothetical protein